MKARKRRSKDGWFTGTSRADLRQIATILKWMRLSQSSTETFEGKSKSWLFQEAVRRWFEEITVNEPEFEVKSFTQAEKLLEEFGWWEKHKLSKNERRSLRSAAKAIAAEQQAESEVTVEDMRRALNASSTAKSDTEELKKLKIASLEKKAEKQKQRRLKVLEKVLRQS